jgi:hypothetical protein
MRGRRSLADGSETTVKLSDERACTVVGRSRISPLDCRRRCRMQPLEPEGVRQLSSPQHWDSHANPGHAEHGDRPLLPSTTNVVLRSAASWHPLLLEACQHLQVLIQETSYLVATKDQQKTRLSRLRSITLEWRLKGTQPGGLCIRR